MALLNMVEALNLALRQEMKRDSKVMVMGEDVSVDGGVFRVTDGLLKLYGADRVVDTPLSESGIVGTAIGLAIVGMKPVTEIQFSGFTYPAFDQMISHASRIRTRSRGRYSCSLVMRAPYGGGIRALEHHSESMEAIWAHIPGLKMVIPATPYDAKGLLIAAIRDPDPVVFYEPKKIYRAFKQEVPEEEYVVQIGKARVVQEGEDVTIVGYGAVLHECQKAIELLPDISCELIDLRSIKPMDTETLVKSVKKTGRVVVVHEAPKTCGVAAEVIARINEKAFLNLEAPPMRVTGFDTVFPLYKLENYYFPVSERIKSAIEKTVKF